MSESTPPAAQPAPTPPAPAVPASPAPAPASPAPPGERTSLGQRIRGSARGLIVPVLAIFSALVIGAFVIVLSDLTFFDRLRVDPGGALGAALDEVLGAYGALFTGSLGNPGTYAAAFASGDLEQITRAFVPISETLLAATPLLFTGLAVALGFQCGLFNIGAEGQLYLGAIFGTFVGFAFTGL